MKRWRVWVLLALLACVPILLSHASGPGLLRDSDTATLLRGIRERQAPISWFAGDWPLQNHFYRPLPTLTFELDNLLYGANAAGYGWTNAILCALCVLALFWLVREMTDSPPMALAAAAVFSLWTLNSGEALSVPCYWAAGAVLLLGLWRHGFKGEGYVPGCLLLIFLGTQLSGVQLLQERLVDWLPGRTASVMTLFALSAMAAYARFERLAGEAMPPLPATSLDRPTATRTTIEAQAARRPWLWAIAAAGLTAAALASYEQAVMLPACLLGVAVYTRLKRVRPHWPLHGVFWLLLVGYLVLRHFILPNGASGYQAQQFRHGTGVWLDLGEYALPNAYGLVGLWLVASEGLIGLATAAPLGAVVAAAGTVTAFFQARRQWVLVLTGWALSFLAFLPMAWLKFFAHYHYWPMALRTIFVIGIARVAWELVSNAVCPPAAQAPPRPSPAPGSLPRP